MKKRFILLQSKKLKLNDRDITYDARDFFYEMQVPSIKVKLKGCCS